MKQIDSITETNEPKPKKAEILVGKTPDKKGGKGFWNKEIRLFKAEMAGWSLPRSAKKELKAQNKASQKTKPALVKNKEVKTNEVSGAEKKSWPKPARIAIRVFVSFLLVLSFVVVSLAAGVYAYKTSYQTKALYGTKILGQEVGGKDLIEVRNLIVERAALVTLNFSVEGKEVQIKPADAGVNFNADGTAVQVLRNGKVGAWYDPWIYSATSLLYRASPYLAQKVQPSFKESQALEYTIDEQKLAGLTQNLSQSFNVQSQNAGLVMKGTDVQVIPAIYGRQIITASVKGQIAAAVKDAHSAHISIQVEKLNPNIVEADTQKSIDQAKVILNTPVSYHYQGSNYVPDKATVGSWIVFNTQKTNGKDQLVPAVDAKLVYPYIYSLAAKINVPAVNTKVTITNGADQKVDQEGKDGLAVDADTASVNTAAALTVSRPVNMELPTYAVKSKTSVNNITVADWSKYIDVNISTQTMCAYLAGGNQQACWPITTGRNGWNTPTGTFLIQRKVYVTSMPNPPSTQPLTNIHYVSYFTAEGHAIHEAWWRSSFGGQDYVWNGSHGCVNASLGVAQWIYDWAPIGTPVIIHY